MMKRHYIYILFCFFIFISISAFAQAPVEFIQNKGQWGDWYQYKAITRGGEVYLENDGFRYALCDAENPRKIDSFHVGLLKDAPLMKFHVYKMTFEGAKKPIIEGLKSQKTYYNYFLGNNPAKWKSEIHPNLAINYNGIYEGIDMHLSSDNGMLVYEFIVQPNASTTQIKLNFDGPDKMYLKDGDLVINTSVGQMKEMKPYAYQNIKDTKVQVRCNYVLQNNKVSFSFPDDYDHSQLLVIDPTVVFCSFTGSTADNWGFTATYDKYGNFYAGGLVNALTSGTSFPVTPGAYQGTFGGGQGGSAIEYAADLGIMKFNPSGTTRIWATYIGGSCNERPHSMIVDTGDNLIIAGRTHSQDYPVTPGAFQTTNGGGWDIIVTKLNAAGSALVGSTYIGGSGDDGINFDSTEVGYGHLKFNYGDDARSEVQVDNIGNIYVTGSTSSTNFPTTSSAIATTLAGLQDGVVFKMNSNLTSLIWSTYLHGSGDDAGYVLAFNNSQTSLYVAGGTSSPDFPVTPGSWHSTYGGDSADGFILKFKNSPPYNVQKGTFVGTSHYDQVYGIQVDNSDNVYVMGQSIGGAFPVTAGVYSNPSSSQFVMKMDSNLTTDLISTVYGSGDPLHTNISPVAFLVDTCENVYISGWGGNLTLASTHSGFCTGMPTTTDAYQSVTDGADFYFIVFAPNMTSLRYATFYGRNTGTTYWEGEHVDGGTSRFDKHGIIYQAICANCGGPSSTPFPTTAGSWATVDASDNCNEAALKIAFNIGPVTVNIVAGPTTSGCAPLTVNFTNLTTNGLNFVWNYGDGSPIDTSFAPSHTFTSAGVYTVTVSASNSNACFRTNDTERIVITVDTGSIYPNFTYIVNDSCGPYTATFTNTSVYGSEPGATTITTFHWDFGDGSTYTGTTPPMHTYPSTGSYTVTLSMADTTACISPVTITKVVTFTGFRISANFTIPDSICLGLPITPIASISNATTINWSCGDTSSSSSSSTNPSYTYTTVGTYTVSLIIANPLSCNGADTAHAVIKVLPVPTANFTFTPITATANTPTTYTNLSVNATRYLWDFGDNTTTTETDPVHQFNYTGVFKTCLTAYNSYNCPSILCKEVPSEVIPIIGLPTGFSPNGDGENDVLYVRGAAIKTLDLKIYNRWGQMVFETTSQTKGWDGTFNGQPQPMEAYAYVLNVSFIDGSAKLLKGNITLLR